MDELNMKIKNYQEKYQEEGAWIYFSTEESIPQQGWKIHISSQIKDSVSIFSICQNVLRDKKCNFKIAKDTETLKRINSPRETSATANKFITVYTQSSMQAREIILELTSLLKKFKSPKILSDFQCGNHSPVHYRFGAFTEIKSYNPHTNKVMYMLKNDAGQFVEDVRANYFSVPYWEKDLFNDDEKKFYFNINDDIPEQSAINRYTFEKILKKSNRGNVHLAVHKQSKEKVIVKQARPFVSDDLTGRRYAVDDLENEYSMLKRFSNKDYTVAFLDKFEVFEDTFLIQSYIDGLTYYELVHENISLELKIKIIDNIVDIVNDLHYSGYKLVDMSPSNFIYRLDGRVFLIDLENVTHMTNNERRVKTPFMVNPDEDLTKSSIEQDYFALAMVSFSLLTGQVLTFSKYDSVYGFSSIDKINETVRVLEKFSGINRMHAQWLVFLLNSSTQKNSIHVGKIPKISVYNEGHHYKDTFNVSIMDFEKEAHKVIEYLLMQNIHKKGRIAKSSEFGEFVNPISFQHGMSGYIKFIATINQFSNLSHLKKWIQHIESNKTHNDYLYKNSLLFGESGYLWSVIDLYIETQDKYYELISRDIAHRIVINFDSSTEVDFALGLSGIIHALIKYSIFFRDLEIENFIKNNISILSEFIQKSENDGKVDNLRHSFAHGLSGIAYTLYCYSIVFEDDSYSVGVETINNQVVEILEKFYSDYRKRYNNLELSWCEGISGLILYLCLIDPKKYNSTIHRAQDRVMYDCFAMGTSYCHGLSSLIQTFKYVNRDISDLKILLISKSFRKHNLLAFQSENRHEDYFDFGVGTLGIYWVLLGYSFPFEMKKEEIKKYECFYKK
ncbi:class III lanthionine synthetase LanKC N-terminal domain-containing protein [Streptococcus respiraculi]|uniref:class III lanthionine synthetase LanKC N-terminal domain-containing protein n=1 Tax=Streptococcus respiraculi TaxID=2021971 RepID=UPI000E70C5E2|nr:lanthionine synthetase LanC family protein [Streptococcus respiraculi]